MLASRRTVKSLWALILLTVQDSEKDAEESRYKVIILVHMKNLLSWNDMPW